MRLVALTLAAVGLLIAVGIGARAEFHGGTEARPGIGDTQTRTSGSIAETLLLAIFVVGPALVLFGLVRHVHSMVVLGSVLYTLLSLAFGFSIGGVHLTTGVPFVVAAAVLGIVAGRNTRRQAA